MSDKRKLELVLMRLLTHPLREDFVTIGLALLESDGGFAEVRFTRDLRMLQCVAPDLDLEWLRAVENEIRGELGTLKRREDLDRFVNERFGTVLEVAPAKAVMTDDPVKEMEVLAGIYLVPLARSGRLQERTGRGAIVESMRLAFESAGVLELMQRNLDVDQYTGMGDPFRIDFGYRVGSEVKMFQAVSVATNVDQTLALGYRFSRIDAGMRREQLEASLTAVVEQELGARDERTRFAIAMLEQNSVRVRTVNEMAAIASEVRGELRA
jgi:hypothetical protein